MKRSTFTHYFNTPIGDGQNPDEPGDQSWNSGQRIHGVGAKGGGSKPVVRGRQSGSAKLGNTAPKHPQKIRG